MSHPTSTRKLESRAVARSYFGTDGVRGIVGEFLTPELVEQLGKASALWSGRGVGVPYIYQAGQPPQVRQAWFEAMGLTDAG